MPPKAISLPPQESYIRNQEKSNRLLHNNDRTSTFDFQRTSSTQNILDYTTDASDNDVADKKVVSYNVSEVMDSPYDGLVPDIILEPFKNSSSGRWSKMPKTTSFQFPSVLPLGFTDDFINDSAIETFEENEEYLLDITKPNFEKSYSVTKGKTKLLNTSLPQSAASFYSGSYPLMEVVESSECIHRLNEYLKSRRKDVKAGVPGRFLRAVMGQDLPDTASVASAIMYAFYLNETQKHEQFCTVPIINMKRKDLSSHAELIWLLDSCQIDHSSLLFVDEVDLAYFDLYGSLRIILLNSDKLSAKQETLKAAIVDIFNCSEDCSCSALIAEKFALTAPENLAAQGFSRLLLAGILLDTENLKSPSCTSKDEYMATLLINGAGRFGCNGFHHILKYKMYGATNLKIIETLLKDFKKWTRVEKLVNTATNWMMPRVGMSSIGVSVAQLFAETQNSTKDIERFRKKERLQFLVIVSGYYSQKNFKREILVVAESEELMRSLLIFLNSKASQLPLKVLDQSGTTDEIRAFEINKVTSRRTIEGLLEEFRVTCLLDPTTDSF